MLSRPHLCIFLATDGTILGPLENHAYAKHSYHVADRLHPYEKSDIKEV